MRVVEQTQRRVENYYYELRKKLFEFDEVLTAQVGSLTPLINSTNDSLRSSSSLTPRRSATGVNGYK